MRRRVGELVALLPGLAAGERTAFDAARNVGMSLRGSGASFGFPRLSELATLVEVAPDADVLRRVEGLVSELEAFVADTDGHPVRCGPWLARAAGLEADGPLFNEPAPDVSTERCWASVERAAGLGPSELVARAASYFGLDVADLGSRTRAALRLVPEALVAAHGVVPVAEDPRTITVATADPTSLALEHELAQLTGRRPILAVAHPAAIAAVMEDLHASSAAVPVSGTKTAGAPEGGRPGKVLVVDDEESFRLLLRTMLEKRGYHVVEASDGVAALEVVGESDPFQLVVADLHMPRMDGLELVWELRDHPESRDLPVIVVTGEEDGVLETQLLEEGADDYVRKPIDPRLFLARVEATVRRSDAPLTRSSRPLGSG